MAIICHVIKKTTTQRIIKFINKLHTVRILNLVYYFLDILYPFSPIDQFVKVVEYTRQFPESLITA